MLYFSKIRIFIITILSSVFIFFTLSNFIKTDNFFIDRNINLGLDLQGGSYLLLEIDNKPVILQTLQNKVVELKKFFKKEKIKIGNFQIEEKSILFTNSMLSITLPRNNTPFFSCQFLSCLDNSR